MTSGPEIADRSAGQGTAEPDPGLARERTALAWTRTAISVAALGGAILKTSPVAGGLVLAMSALVWTAGRPPRHERARPGDRRRLLLVTVTVILVSCTALVLTLRTR